MEAASSSELEAIGKGGGWVRYARVYDATGAAQTGAIALTPRLPAIKDFSVVAMDSHANFLASWERRRPDGSSWGIYGRLFRKNGTALTGETLINSTTANTQE